MRQSAQSTSDPNICKDSVSPQEGPLENVLKIQIQGILNKGSDWAKYQNCHFGKLKEYMKN